jgi:hypothetical protein
MNSSFISAKRTNKTATQCGVCLFWFTVGYLTTLPISRQYIVDWQADGLMMNRRGYWTNLTFMVRASLMYSFKYNQQDATLYNIFYCCQCSTCIRRFSRPSSGAQTVRTASGICQACLLLPLAWVSCSPTLAVAASKLDIYQMLYVQFEPLVMGGKTAWNM